MSATTGAEGASAASPAAAAATAGASGGETTDSSSVSGAGGTVAVPPTPSQEKEEESLSSSASTATPPPPPPPAAAKEEEEEETALSLDKAFEEGVNRAMRGDPGVLRQVLANGVEWRGPLGQNLGLEAVEAELRGLGQLLAEPRLSVFSSKNGAKELEWVGSGTWQLPWLPRYIVRGKSSIETGADGKVCVVCVIVFGVVLWSMDLSCGWGVQWVSWFVLFCLGSGVAYCCKARDARVVRQTSNGSRTRIVFVS